MATLSITILSALAKFTLSITTLIIMTKLTLSIMKLSIMTLSTITKLIPSIKNSAYWLHCDTQHKDLQNNGIIVTIGILTFSLLAKLTLSIIISAYWLNCDAQHKVSLSGTIFAVKLWVVRLGSIMQCVVMPNVAS
jgi:hypothetical protein